MSGYLQRLASQAVKPQGTLRPLISPFTGPIRATERTESILEQELLDETVYTVAEDMATTQQKRVSPKLNSSEKDESDAFDPARVDAPSRLKGATTPFQPLLSETKVEMVNPLFRASVSPRERPELGQPEGQAEASREIVLQEDRSQVRKEPSRTSQVPWPSPTDDIRVLQPVAPSRPGHPRSVSSSMAETRGADEIQINIGRIEVTAMQQATPRPSAPARKSVNLEEYLSRRNGRNG